MPEKIIKALTMVRNDRFLSKWVEYYGRELGYENLYVFFDGEDQDIPSFCNGVNARKIPKMKGTVVVTDRKRSRFMAKCAKELLADGADMVIATDADEFLVIDPNLGIGLKKFLSSLPDRPCHSGLGVDVMQHIPDESPSISISPCSANVAGDGFIPVIQSHPSSQDPMCGEVDSTVSKARISILKKDYIFFTSEVSIRKSLRKYPPI